MGFCCISLDFEIRWGVRHLFKSNFDTYRRNLEAVYEITPNILEVFQNKKIPSTWATVAALALNDWDDLEHFLKPSKIGFTAFSNELDKENLNLYFAPKLVSELKQNDYVELATHTLTHPFALEPGVSSGGFVQDVKSSIDVFVERGFLRPTSLVFPRNQVTYLDELKRIGIGKVRFEQLGDIGFHNTLRGNNFLRRSRRFSRNILPHIKTSTKIRTDGTNATLFVNFNLPEMLWRWQISRIKNEIKQLDQNECLHLWWHPHNMLDDFNDGLPRLQSLLEVIKLSEDSGLKTALMKDI